MECIKSSAFAKVRCAHLYDECCLSFLTNKVKEISYKIIHKFYPVKQFCRNVKVTLIHLVQLLVSFMSINVNILIVNLILTSSNKN